MYGAPGWAAVVMFSLWRPRTEAQAEGSRPEAQAGACRQL